MTDETLMALRATKKNENAIRQGLKFKIPNPKSQTIPNIKIQMTKTYLEKLLDFGYLSFEFIWYLMLGIWNLNKGS